MTEEILVSYAQNGEDVVLWRALGHLTHGRYVDVGGWDPDVDSVTRLFYEHGWRGVDVEPVPEFAEKFRDRRPDNEVVEAVVTDADQEHAVLHRFGDSGLSTLVEEFARRHEDSGLEHQQIQVPVRRLDDIIASSRLVAEGPIHFLKIDVEGAEEHVLRSLDLARWRPWVLVIEATEPNSSVRNHERWEPLVLAAGYTFTLFDGLSRFYVADEHSDLADALGHPASPVDGYVSADQLEVRRQVDSLSAEIRDLEDRLAVTRRDMHRWRNQAVAYWANAMTTAQSSEDAAKHARNETQRVRRQLARARENLQLARAERKRLKSQVDRQATRIDRMRARIERMSARLEQVEGSQDGSVRTRLRRAVGKVRR